MTDRREVKQELQTREEMITALAAIISLRDDVAPHAEARYKFGRGPDATPFLAMLDSIINFLDRERHDMRSGQCASPPSEREILRLNGVRALIGRIKLNYFLAAEHYLTGAAEHLKSAILLPRFRLSMVEDVIETLREARTALATSGGDREYMCQR